MNILGNPKIAQAISSTTASQRFKGDLDVGLQEIVTNLVPYPKFTLPVVSYAPFHAKDKVNNKLNTKELTEACFDSDNCMARINVYNGRYFSCLLLARGDVSALEVNFAIQHIKKFELGLSNLLEN